MSTELEKTTQPQARKMERVIPASDILERPDGWHIVVDMPGVMKDDLVIDMQERELILRGKSAYTFKEGRELLRSEFAPVEYARTFTLSDEIDREKVKAVFKNGVLDLFLPKAEKAKPKRIEITAG